MPKKIHFEWELPDVLVDELTQDRTEVSDTIKAAAVLDWSGPTGSHCAAVRSFCRCPILPSWS